MVAATRTVVTELTLDNPNGDLWLGAYVSVQFAFPGDPDVLTVPEQAVLFRAQGTQVALIGSGGKVKLQDVTVGRNPGTDVQVVSGLRPDDKLVANPSLGPLDGQQVKLVQAAAGADPGSGSSTERPAQPPGAASGGPDAQTAPGSPSSAGVTPAN